MRQTQPDADLFDFEEAETLASGHVVQVAVPVPVEASGRQGTYDYRVASGQNIRPGSYVSVRFGKQRKYGVVWGEGGESGLPARKIKPIDQVLDLPPMPKTMRQFISWVADYTMSPLGSVLKMALSAPDALNPPKLPPRYEWSGMDWPAHLRQTPARLALLEAAKSVRHPQTAKALASAAGCSTSGIAALAKAGLLRTHHDAGSGLVQQIPPDHPGPQLSPAQSEAAGALCALLHTPRFAPALLDGVTGSGKTEVYFEAIAACLRQGKQVLVLLPEIALSTAWYDRFRERFGAAPLAWHSHLGKRERRENWLAIAHGRGQLVVGARSGLFLPFSDLGLIVVDEEHDASFKQEEGVIYNARDMAVLRAKLCDAPIILSSATPSVETEVNARTGKYQRVHLPERHGGAQMPEVGLIDLRTTPPERDAWLSPPLIEAMEQCLAEDEQVLLFLNRRGYAPLTICRHCGHRMQCPNCTAWLVEHRTDHRLICHHCGYGGPPPPKCPECEAEDQLTACGPGVERVAEEVRKRFPDKRSTIIASDTTTRMEDLQRLIAEMRDRRWDIIIGTQIMAKGHHFPMLTLVGAIDGDLGLAGGDLRAGERSFQLLHQVSGRAGRADRPGRVLIQTYQPDHPVMQALAAGDREQFMQAEIRDREAEMMPPFGRLAALVVSSMALDVTEEACTIIARSAPQHQDMLILGPAPAPLAKLRSRYRYRFLIRAHKNVPIQKRLHDWLSPLKLPRSSRLQIDIDPYSFM